MEDPKAREARIVDEAAKVIRLVAGGEVVSKRMALSLYARGYLKDPGELIDGWTYCKACGDRVEACGCYAELKVERDTDGILRCTDSKGVVTRLLTLSQCTVDEFERLVSRSDPDNIWHGRYVAALKFIKEELAEQELTCKATPEGMSKTFSLMERLAEAHVHNWVHWADRNGYAGAECECGATQGDCRLEEEPAEIAAPSQQPRVVNRVTSLRISEGRTAFGYLKVGQRVLVRGYYTQAKILNAIGFGKGATYIVKFDKLELGMTTYRASIRPHNIFAVA